MKWINQKKNKQMEETKQPTTTEGLEETTTCFCIVEDNKEGLKIAMGSDVMPLDQIGSLLLELKRQWKEGGKENGGNSYLG